MSVLMYLHTARMHVCRAVCVCVCELSVCCCQDCELAELRLTVDKIRNSASLQLPASLAACSSSSPAASVAAAAAAGLCLSVCLIACLSLCVAATDAFVLMFDIASYVGCGLFG